MSEVTQILHKIDEGDPHAAERLLPLVYEELRKLASVRMAHEPPGQTLQPTALVHEAWLRLGGSESRAWNGRAHFFGAAAEAMRRILIDKARRRKALRHGSGVANLDIHEVEVAAPAADDQLLDMDSALERFSSLDPRKGELIKLRYFVGMTIEEAAQALGISEATAKRWWEFARAWLYAELHKIQT